MLTGGLPWPCAQARLLLKAEYADHPIDLAVYLSGLYHEATHDLFRLNPHDGPTPRELFERFVAWGPYRRGSSRIGDPAGNHGAAGRRLEGRHDDAPPDPKDRLVWTLS
ncbi:hypothetical protein ACIBOV_03580 [Micromonospora chersina]|uniref:hypothetical protein n=1 Tax=Micromonospora chersina TaxID=47854 RepID=UPI0037A1BBEB